MSPPYTCSPSLNPVCIARHIRTWVNMKGPGNEKGGWLPLMRMLLYLQ